MLNTFIVKDGHKGKLCHCYHNVWSERNLTSLLILNLDEFSS